MCEYLCGAFFGPPLSEAIRDQLRRETTASGYHIHLDDEIDPSMRAEAASILSALESGNDWVLYDEEVRKRHYTVPLAPRGETMFNITTTARDYCVEEVLSREIDSHHEKGERVISDDVPLGKCLRRLLAVAQPARAVIIYNEGATQNWIPLERRQLTLDRLIGDLAEYHDRPDYDARGIHEILPST